MTKADSLDSLFHGFSDASSVDSVGFAEGEDGLPRDMNAVTASRTM